MKIRKQLNYPPFCNISKIEIKGNDYDKIFKEAIKICSYLNDIGKKDKHIVVLGPSSSSIPKINNIYQVQVIVKYKDTSHILEAFKFILDKYKQNKNINVDLDINSLRI